MTPTYAVSIMGQKYTFATPFVFGDGEDGEKHLLSFHKDESLMKLFDRLNELQGTDLLYLDPEDDSGRNWNFEATKHYYLDHMNRRAEIIAFEQMYPAQEYLYVGVSISVTSDNRTKFSILLVKSNGVVEVLKPCKYTGNIKRLHGTTVLKLHTNYVINYKKATRIFGYDIPESVSIGIETYARLQSDVREKGSNAYKRWRASLEDLDEEYKFFQERRW